jgi:hypothetical protein
MSEDIANVEVPEIELTPEMVAAGELALAGFSTYYSSLDEEVERVFRAIMEAGGFNVHVSRTKDDVIAASDA